MIIISKEEFDTGEVVLDKVREAMDAKEGWVKITRVRKARDRKNIVSCDTREERAKVVGRLSERAGYRLVVEEIQNKDPLIILKGVLLRHSDEDVVRAMKDQNQARW